MLHLSRLTLFEPLTQPTFEKERIQREATKPRLDTYDGSTPLRSDVESALHEALGIPHHFKIGDRVTDGLIRGTVTQLDPNRPLVGVEFWPWPSERRWDWFSEDRLRLDQ